MRFKLTVVALYIFLALALAVGLRHTAAYSGERVGVPQDAAQRPAISLDATNGRGGIRHVIDGVGGSSTAANADVPVTVVRYP